MEPNRQADVWNMQESSLLLQQAAAAAASMEWQERKRLAEIQELLLLIGEDMTPPSLPSCTINICSPLIYNNTEPNNHLNMLPYQADDDSLYDDNSLFKLLENQEIKQNAYENHLNINIPSNYSNEELINAAANAASSTLPPPMQRQLHPPPPPPPPPNHSSIIAVSEGGVHTGRPPRRKGTPSYREAHIHSERQRRQDMTGLFNTLRSLLPNMQDDEQFKGDRCTLLECVIEYVQELDKKVQELGRVREELMDTANKRRRLVKQEGGIKCQRRGGPANQMVPAEVSLANVSVRFWGHVDIFITLNCPKQRGIWPQLLALLQDTLQLDVQNVTLSATPFFCVHSIYAKVAEDENQQELSCEKLRQILGEFVEAYNF